MNFQQTNLNTGDVNTTYTGVHPTKINYTELVCVTLRLWIKSESGDNVLVQPAVSTDNICSDEAAWYAFEKSVEQIRQQLSMYLKRRDERKLNWKG
jgi:hypothetical protein